MKEDDSCVNSFSKSDQPSDHLLSVSVDWTEIIQITSKLHGALSDPVESVSARLSCYSGEMHLA